MRHVEASMSFHAHSGDVPSRSRGYVHTLVPEAVGDLGHERLPADLYARLTGACSSSDGKAE